jgi:hypothetical protein
MSFLQNTPYRGVFKIHIMNTHASKTILTAIGLLLAGAISSAQTDGVSYVLPKTSAPNFYLEAGGGFISRTENGDGFNGLGKMSGGTVTFGWRVNKTSKIQLEAGLYSASDSDYVFGHKLDADVRINTGGVFASA